MLRTYFRFIQFSLGLYEGKEFLDGSFFSDAYAVRRNREGFDWGAFFDFAKKQTLVGVAFDGIQKLPKEVAPSLDLLMRWVGMSQKIEYRNKILDKATVAIYNKVVSEGYQCCILKGQGNAVLYPHPKARTPGDVDVWVNASREEIRALAHSLVGVYNGHVNEESINHIGLTLNGVVVELHCTPGFMANFVYNCRLQKWLKQNVNAQCCNLIDLVQSVDDKYPVSADKTTPKDTCIAVPTIAFNVVYQLYHLYHHYFYEGVGMRQVLDYYFVVKGIRESKFSQVDGGMVKKNTIALWRELKYLGLWRFAGAMMFVLHEVLGLPETDMIAPMDAKRGRMLLGDILNGGNFGQYDERHAWGHNLLRLHRDLRLLRYYPAEALSEPIFRIWHYCWRKKNL